jgi:WD40 repeat protein
VAISHDGTRIISSRSDHTIVQIWDARTGEALHELTGLSSVVHPVAISHDGTCAASGSQDSTVQIWDVNTGKALNELKGHSSWVLSVSFSNDGTRIISCSYDDTIRMWDTFTGDALHRWKCDPIPRSVRFSSGETCVTVTYLVGSNVFEIPFDARPLSPSPDTDWDQTYVLKDGWVFEGEERRCWVPQLHRGESGKAWTSSPSTFVMGTAHGRLTILHFHPKNPV